ncbi:hypothetical protein BB561_005459 [Smittium simulii]|uniref:Uncharacterized protein n=1 Tax=Smittium simulii TaxID=133385 RepID=A0A2T9YAC1_9FUNG|nr:hypothetical protein BB561_005459 [Smittium simulii]
MRLSIAGILLAITNVHLATSAAVPETELSNQNNNAKEAISKQSSGQVKNQSYRGYLNKGKYWFWDGESDDTFLMKLRYKPRNYFGQRFEYLFENILEFKNNWLENLAFRNRWDSEIEFRNLWFGRVDYLSWKYELIDNFDDYYYGRGRFSGYTRWRHGNGHLDLIETLEVAQGAVLEEAQEADLEKAQEADLEEAQDAVLEEARDASFAIFVMANVYSVSQSTTDGPLLPSAKRTHVEYSIKKFTGLLARPSIYKEISVKHFLDDSGPTKLKKMCAGGSDKRVGCSWYQFFKNLEEALNFVTNTISDNYVTGKFSLFSKLLFF